MVVAQNYYFALCPYEVQAIEGLVLVGNLKPLLNLEVHNTHTYIISNFETNGNPQLWLWTVAQH